MLIVEGLVKPDGTRELPQKLDLPPGRVLVTLQSAAEPVRPDRFWSMLETIWADLRASSRSGPTREEIDAEIDALRNDAEAEMQAVERLQEQFRRSREQAQAPQEQSQ